MKHKSIFLLVVIIMVASLAAPGKAEEQKFSGFLMDYKDLTPGPEGGAKMRFIKPGVDFKKYKKVMLDSVVFFFDESVGYKGIEPATLNELAEDFNREVVKNLGGDFPLTSQPSVDTMRIRVAITRLEPANPGRSLVSSVVPVSLAISLAKKGTTGKWTGAGKTAIEVEALDSMTNERIAAALDEQFGGKVSSFSKWGSAKEAFEFWGKRIRALLDKAQEQGGKTVNQEMGLQAGDNER